MTRAVEAQLCLLHSSQGQLPSLKETSHPSNQAQILPYLSFLVPLECIVCPGSRDLVFGLYSDAQFRASSHTLIQQLHLYSSPVNNSTPSMSQR